MKTDKKDVWPDFEEQADDHFHPPRANISEEQYRRGKECTDALNGVLYPEEYIENILKSRDETWLKLCDMHSKYLTMSENYEKLFKKSKTQDAQLEDVVKYLLDE